MGSIGFLSLFFFLFEVFSNLSYTSVMFLKEQFLQFSHQTLVIHQSSLSDFLLTAFFLPLLIFCLFVLLFLFSLLILKAVRGEPTRPTDGRRAMAHTVHYFNHHSPCKWSGKGVETQTPNLLSSTSLGCTAEPIQLTAFKPSPALSTVQTGGFRSKIDRT